MMEQLRASHHIEIESVYTSLKTFNQWAKLRRISMQYRALVNQAWQSLSKELFLKYEF